jgi:Leucine-rich repeat (LRR) protein
MDRVYHYLDFEDILNLLLVSNITDNIIVNHVDIKTRRIYNLFLQYKKIIKYTSLTISSLQYNNLTHLDLSNNYIIEIKNLDKLPNLTHLILRNNIITEIKKLELPNLTHLNLSCNSFTIYI